jgi:hypothetical protein
MSARNLILPVCTVVGAIVLYALYKKGDVCVSVSIWRKLFDFTLTAKERLHSEKERAS